MVDLHILNGDAITPLFQQAEIPGEVFVWSEVLCAGRSAIDMASEVHWGYRQTYLKETYSFFEQEKFDGIKKRFQSLDTHQYKGIFLWFEYDLFCQINMLALLAWLSTANYAAAQIHLVCVGAHPEYDQLVGLGELTQKQFAALINTRQQLKETDLQTASTLWTLWCTGHHEDLVETGLQLNQDRFPYVVPALEAHIKRFPYSSTLLTEIENQIIDLIRAKPQTAKDIVRQLLNRENYYGFGDVQYYNIIKNLAPILREEQGLLYLDASGDEQQQSTNHRTKINRNFFYGGTSQKDYFYSERIGQLIKKGEL